MQSTEGGKAELTKNNGEIMQAKKTARLAEFVTLWMAVYTVL
jgi:hypothetical protein